MATYKCITMFQLETLQHAALLVYGKRFVASNLFEIKRAHSATHAAGDNIIDAAVNDKVLHMYLLNCSNLFLIC